MRRRTILEPGQLLAAIPVLLEYTPTNSAVIVSLDIGTVVHFGPTIRLDPPDALDSAAVAQQVGEVLGSQPCNALMIAIISEPDTNAGRQCPPHHQFVTELERTANNLGIRVDHAFWIDTLAPGLTWHSYHRPHNSGTLPDPRTTELAALAVTKGHPIYPNHEAFANQLAPHPAHDLTRRKRLLTQLPPITPSAGLALILNTIRQVAAATPPNEIILDDHTIARLTQALTHQAVYDTSLTLTLDTNTSTAAQRLWTLLTRATPRPHVARPATLLATSTYLQGKGPLARIALGKALADNPRHKAALTLRSAIDRGLPPNQLRDTLAVRGRSTSTQRGIPLSTTGGNRVVGTMHFRKPASTAFDG